MLSIKTFNGDYQQLYEMILKSWKEEYHAGYDQPVQDFTPDLMEWHFTRPNSIPDLLIGAYFDEKLVGFGASIPHTLSNGNSELRAALSTFLTIDSDFKGKGVGKALVFERAKRVKEFHFDLNYFVFDEGHTAEKMYQKISQSMGFSLRHFLRFTFLSKSLDQVKVRNLIRLNTIQSAFLPFVTQKDRPTNQATPVLDIENNFDFISSLFDLKSENCISIKWSMAELRHQLRNKLSDTFIYNDGSKLGLINFYNSNLIGNSVNQQKELITTIDFVQFRNMSFFDKRSFVREFCVIEKAKGSCLILLPTFPCYDLLPFYSNLFIPTFRYHNIRGFDYQNKIDPDVSVLNMMFR